MHVERAKLEDAHAIAEIHVLTWRAVYQGIVPADYLATLSVEKREALWRDSIAKELLSFGSQKLKVASLAGSRPVRAAIRALLPKLAKSGQSTSRLHTGRAAWVVRCGSLLANDCNNMVTSQSVCGSWPRTHAQLSFTLLPGSHRTYRQRKNSRLAASP